MAVTYRVRPDDAYFATMMKRYWRQRPVLLRPDIQFTILPIVTGGVLLSALWSGTDHVILWIGAVVWALIVGPGLYLLTKALLLQRFRTNRALKGEIVYRLSDDGISFNGPSSRSVLQWQIYPRGVRFSDGIMLVRPKVICWLPDSALADANPVEATAFVARQVSLRHVA